MGPLVGMAKTWVKYLDFYNPGIHSGKTRIDCVSGAILACLVASFIVIDIAYKMKKMYWGNEKKNPKEDDGNRNTKDGKGTDDKEKVAETEKEKA
ncbi:hypothetical protein Q3G72_016307 [Acer saccharum]|nr:hypothetical protein Q3G72_016307 [Acer saccharum]